jgi:NADPH:quinone reductase-like Zn-dependent oxidoreductase
MKGIFFTGYGNRSVLEYSETIEVPKIKKPTEVLIQIHASSINPIDSIFRNGYLHNFVPLSFPSGTGYDLSGVVVETGDEVKKFKKGDEVFSRVPQSSIGTLQGFNVVDEQFVALKPKNLSHEEAASIPLAAETIFQAFRKANFQKGQKVFISGGAGGTGTFALQLAKNVLGASCVATTTSETKVELCKSLGADIVIDYKKDDFTKILKDFDFALDLTKEASKCLQVLKKNGICYSLNIQKTPELQKQSEDLEVTFDFFGLTPSGDDLAEIGKYFEDSKMKTIIDKIYDLKDAQKAFEHLEGGRTTGKIVLKVE